jgi:NAD(P)H dehydrogenase (quinone)
MLIVVTAANGNIGSRAMPLLLEAGHQVRAVVHSRASAARLAALGVEPVVADVSKELDRSVFAGADRALLVAPVSEAMTEIGNRLTDAAVAGGAQRVVRVSIDSQYIDAGAMLGIAHTAADGHLERTGVRHTILRPSGFMQNLLAMAPMIQQGMIVAPTGDGAVPFIDAADIAASAVAVLTDVTEIDGPVDISGPEALTFAQIADRLSGLLGHDVTHISPTGDEARAGLAAGGFDGWLLDAMLDDTAHVANGVGATVRNGVQRLTGRQPTTVDTFLRANLEAFRSQQ